MAAHAAVTATRQPPTTAWGALLIAAEILENSGGLARIDTYQADLKVGKLDPYTALQDALWPPPAVITRADGGIPKDRTTGKPYWAAVAMFDVALGGEGHLWSSLIDQLVEDPQSTAATVAGQMRRAARRP